MSFYLFAQQDKKRKELRASLNFHIYLWFPLWEGSCIYIAYQARFDSVEFQGKVAIKTWHYTYVSLLFFGCCFCVCVCVCVCFNKVMWILYRSNSLVCLHLFLIFGVIQLNSWVPKRNI